MAKQILLAAIVFGFINSLTGGVDSEIITATLTADKPKIIAHRGANDRFNESTITAYKIASENGVDSLEMDLRMTKDGELVVMHDQTIDRTTNGSGAVSDLTLNELRTVETVEVFGEETLTEAVPTLEEVLQTFLDTEHYYIETRLVNGQAVMEKDLLELLNEYELIEKKLVTLQSFSKVSLEKIKSIAPDVPLTYLFSKGKFNLEEASEVTYSFIGIEASDITSHVVKVLHDQGKEVHVYFTDKEKQKHQQKDMYLYGVDGYFTDDIAFTKSLLKEGEGF
ncbi:glycerophosphodiester phosphodiesterase [Paraliobacillus sediminis]|uniref:glycerophosphodiester phosphodiesterase n=1 Tax=Paraliobacillus sediminis TaxID=1885916 RepID=UPI0013C35394|nr:glycerophosphodiester phosphodiesterase family protein [Paraliobacillus sediminis]